MRRFREEASKKSRQGNICGEKREGNEAWGILSGVGLRAGLGCYKHPNCRKRVNLSFIYLALD